MCAYNMCTYYINYERERERDREKERRENTKRREGKRILTCMSAVVHQYCSAEYDAQEASLP